MTARTMTMFTNDFGMNRGRASPLFRVMKPHSHLLEMLMALADPLFRGVERGAAAVGDWYRRRRTDAELSRLDDHLLRDIGISRDGLGGWKATRSDAQRFDTRSRY